jgi:hypothetical protein
VAPHEKKEQKRLTQKFQRMAMDMEVAGQKMHYDSAKPAEAVDPMGLSKTLGALVGQELRLVMGANNEVVDVENADMLAKTFGSANPMAAKMIEGMINKETLAQSFKQVGLKGLPGKPVQPGDSWPYTVTMNLPQIGMVKLEGKYTFSKMVQRAGGMCAELAEEGTMTMNFDEAMAGAAKTAGTAPMSLKVKEGKLNGTIWFDPALGAPRESLAKQTMVMEMANPADPSQTMTIPMNQTINMTLLKVESGK